MGNAAFDAFRYQFLADVRRPLEIEVVLEVAVAAAAAHRADRAHAAVFLEAAALVEDQFAGALVGAGEQIADHRRAAANGQGLGDVARESDAAVGNDRHVVLRGGARAVHDGGDHRDTDAGHHAGCADRAGADADLHRVDTPFDERQRRGARGDVARHQFHFGELLPDASDDVEHTL